MTTIAPAQTPMFVAAVRRASRSASSLRRAAVCATAVMALLAFFTPAVVAQGVRASARAGPGAGGQSAITSREIDAWNRLLDLSEVQREAVRTLHQAYQEEYRLESKALQDVVKNAQQEFMESQDTSAFKEVARKSAVHTGRMEALDRQLMDDVKSLLEPRQAEMFPRVERYHRRVKSLPGGLLAGESVNLVTIIDDLGIDAPTPELKDALEQYELDLDRALAERDQQRKEMEKQSEEAMKDFDPSKMDFSKIREMMQNARKSGVRVRDVNEKHARRIAAVVPADKKPDFEDRVRRATYPSVYKQPYVLKAIDAALKFDDLSPEESGRIVAIKDGYTRDAAAANEKWAAAISVEEKDGGGDPFMGFGRMIPGAGGSDEPAPTEDAKKARRELDKATLEKLKALLTEEQIERLPERESEFPWMGNFGGGNDEDADERPSRPGRRR